MNSNTKILNRIYYAFMLMLFSVKLDAQQIQGIYLDGSDFRNNRLALAKVKGIKCKIKLHDLPYKPVIKVKYSEKEYEFKKDSIFGYKDNSGNDFRFFNRKIYPVLNQGEQILLYRTERSAGGPKSSYQEINYFFSKDEGSPVQPLTIYNLENCFKDNKIFCEYLEVHFKNDAELSEYDPIHKMYKLNHLLELSTKSKNN